VPPGQRRISYRNRRMRPAARAPTGPTATTPRARPFARAGASSTTKGPAVASTWSAA
jgi:hypothetical protein